MLCFKTDVRTLLISQFMKKGLKTFRNCPCRLFAMIVTILLTNNIFVLVTILMFYIWGNILFILQVHLSTEILPSITFQNIENHTQLLSTKYHSFQKSRMRIDKSMMIGVMVAFSFLFLCWLATEFQWTESFMRQRELTTKTSMQTSATKEVRW